MLESGADEDNFEMTRAGEATTHLIPLSSSEEEESEEENDGYNGDTRHVELASLSDSDPDSEDDASLLPNSPRKRAVVKVKSSAGSPQEESFLSITLQIFFPFLVAGMGMVGAGLVLDVVQHWRVFVDVSELFILVPALLGLKGNLEMTLASRLSTQANLGNMDTRSDAVSLVISNLALVQCQAIVVALLASVFAVAMDWFSQGVFELDHGLLLCASSLVTASIASFTLGLVMIFVILGSRHCHINPDNVATPIAASLGDLTTLALLSWIASILYADLDQDTWLAPGIVIGYVLFVPVCIFVARRNPHTKIVLREGWTPVLLAMVISSLGGLILDEAVSRFDGIAVFQPVMNGVGGNLAAVQASRISTFLHGASSGLGTLPPGEDKVCLNPCAVLFGRSVHCRTARILLAMVIPGHLIFTYSITFIEAGHTSPTFVFLSFYLLAAVLQVLVLLHTTHWLIHWFWKLKMDPDNSAIPYLTALGDLLGGFLLWLAFEVLFLIGDKDTDVGD